MTNKEHRELKLDYEMMILGDEITLTFDRTFVKSTAWTFGELLEPLEYASYEPAIFDVSNPQIERDLGWLLIKDSFSVIQDLFEKGDREISLQYWLNDGQENTAYYVELNSYELKKDLVCYTCRVNEGKIAMGCDFLTALSLGFEADYFVAKFLGERLMRSIPREYFNLDDSDAPF